MKVNERRTVVGGGFPQPWREIDAHASEKLFSKRATVKQTVCLAVIEIERRPGR